jgi:hypothetical protein
MKKKKKKGLAQYEGPGKFASLGKLERKKGCYVG